MIEIKIVVDGEVHSEYQTTVMDIRTFPTGEHFLTQITIGDGAAMKQFVITAKDTERLDFMQDNYGWCFDENDGGTHKFGVKNIRDGIDAIITAKEGGSGEVK